MSAAAALSVFSLDEELPAHLAECTVNGEKINRTIPEVYHTQCPDGINRTIEFKFCKTRTDCILPLLVFNETTECVCKTKTYNAHCMGGAETVFDDTCDDETTPETTTHEEIIEVDTVRNVTGAYFYITPAYFVAVQNKNLDVTRFGEGYRIGCIVPTFEMSFYETRSSIRQFLTIHCIGCTDCNGHYHSSQENDDSEVFELRCNSGCNENGEGSEATGSGETNTTTDTTEPTEYGTWATTGAEGNIYNGTGYEDESFPTSNSTDVAPVEEDNLLRNIGYGSGGLVGAGILTVGLRAIIRRRGRPSI